MNRSTGHANALKNSRVRTVEGLRTSAPDKPRSTPGSRRPNPTLHRAYPLKERLRLVLQPTYAEALALEAWIAWARRCQIERFVKLQRTTVSHKAEALAAIEHGQSNGLVESVNTRIRLITRIAFN